VWLSVQYSKGCVCVACEGWIRCNSEWHWFEVFRVGELLLYSVYVYAGVVKAVRCRIGANRRNRVAFWVVWCLWWSWSVVSDLVVLTCLLVWDPGFWGGSRVQGVGSV